MARRKPSLRVVVEAFPIRQGSALATRVALLFSMIIACSFLVPVALASFQFQRHCKTALVLSDANHDHFLNRHDEYVSFLRQFAAEGLQSTALPAPLQTHFDKYKGENDQIDILEATQQRTDSFLDNRAVGRQGRFLEAFCNATEEIIRLLDVSSGSTLPIDSASRPSAASNNPSPSLRGGIPGVEHNPVLLEKETNRELQSLQDGNGRPNIFLGRQRRVDSVSILNAWQVSNSFGYTADFIMSSPDWEGLEDSYVAFVTNIVSEMSNETLTSTNRNNPRRILLVSFDPQTAELVDMVDSDCPPSALQKSSCQIVYGQFELATDENVNDVDQRYFNATQTAIQNGRLQQQLDMVDAGNDLYIERAVDLQEFPFTSAAAATESDLRGDTDDFDESNDGLGLVGFLLIFGACTIVVVCIIAAMTLPKRDDRIIPEEKPVWTGNKDEAVDEGDSLEDKIKNKMFREQVEALVEKNCPQEKENIDAMMQQFAGREEELIRKLQSMTPMVDESLLSTKDAPEEIVFSMEDNSRSTQDKHEEEDSFVSESSTKSQGSSHMESEADNFVSEASESQDGSASSQSQAAGSDEDGSFVSEGSLSQDQVEGDSLSQNQPEGHQSFEPEGLYVSANEGLDEPSVPETIPESERATSLQDTGKRIHVNDLHNLLGHPSEDTTRNTGKYYGLIVVGVFRECEFCKLGYAHQKTIPKTWDPQSDEPDFGLFNLPTGDSLKSGDQNMQSGDGKEGSLLNDQLKADISSEPEDSYVSKDDEMSEAEVSSGSGDEQRSEAFASEVIPESERAITLQDAGKKIHVNDLHNLLGHPSEDTTRKAGKYYGLTVVGDFAECEVCKLEHGRQKTIPKTWDPQSDEPDYSLFNLSRVSLNHGDLRDPNIQSRDGKAGGNRSVQESPTPSTLAKEDEKAENSKQPKAPGGQEAASSISKTPAAWNGDQEKQHREAVGRDDDDVSESSTEESVVLRHGDHEEDSFVSEASVPQNGTQKKQSRESNKDGDSFVSEPPTAQDQNRQRGLDEDSFISDRETQRKQPRRIDDHDGSFVSESSTDQDQSPKQDSDNDLASGESGGAQSGAQVDRYESSEDESFVTQSSSGQNGGDRVSDTSESTTDKALSSGAIKDPVGEYKGQGIIASAGYPKTSIAAPDEGSLSQHLRDELDKLRRFAAEKSEARRRAEEEARLADEARNLAEKQARLAIEERLKAEEAALNVTPPLPVESEQPTMQANEKQVATVLSDDLKDLKEESETSEQFMQEFKSVQVDLQQQAAPSHWDDNENAISWDAATDPIDRSAQVVPSGFDDRQNIKPFDVTTGTKSIESIQERGGPHTWDKNGKDSVLKPVERVDQDQFEQDRKRTARSVWEKVGGQWVSREVLDDEGKGSSSSEYCSSSESSSEYYKSEDEDTPGSSSEYYSSEDEGAPGSHWMKEGWKKVEKKRRYDPKYMIL